MKIHYNGDPICSYADWETCFRKAYGNKDDAPWKQGKSAESFAEFFTPGLPGTSAGEDFIVHLIQQMTKCSNVYLDEAEIEHLSPFDSFTHPRQQDMGIYGRIDDRSLFVGVEAKVDEKFDNRTISKAFNTVTNPNSKVPDRVHGLLKEYFCGIEPNNDSIKDLRYQLFYYLAGSVCENADVIFMPVLVFNTFEYKKHAKQVAANLADYNSFMKAAGFQDYYVTGIPGMKNAYQKVIKGKQVYSCYIVIDL